MGEKTKPEELLDDVELTFSQQTGMVKAVAGGILRPLVQVLRVMLAMLIQLSDRLEKIERAAKNGN